MAQELVSVLLLKGYRLAEGPMLNPGEEIGVSPQTAESLIKLGMATRKSPKKPPADTKQRPVVTK